MPLEKAPQKAHKQTGSSDASTRKHRRQCLPVGKRILENKRLKASQSSAARQTDFAKKA